MDEKIYNTMKWPEIEGIVCSDTDSPKGVLGAKVIRGGVLVQAFEPFASGLSVVNMDNGEVYGMEKVDDTGFYATIVPEKKVFKYMLIKVDSEGKETKYYDSYSFGDVIPDKDLKKFNAGVNYKVYEILGAHLTKVDGIEGVLFAVWAPMAVRVSVVGDFNNWDGRMHQMTRRGDTGVFEIFVPGLKSGELYKYEIKKKGDLLILKADPYANASELRPDTASIVTDLSTITWNDDKWIEKRKKANYDEEPMSIYELHLGSFKRPNPEDKESFYNYRELAPLVADYVNEMNYTHIEIMPIMEHPLDASWGYQVTGYYAPTSRYGSPEDFAYFVNYLHKKNIGVILDWVPAHFPKDDFGLAKFDGSCLYEHLDWRKGEHPHWGTLIYNYGRPEVCNFLIANALFWVDKFHADGIRMDAVASMLYLDYGKNDGEWVPNIYGGNENLEAIEMIKNLNTAFKKNKDGAILIAEESTAWPMVTSAVKNEGLGFDYKWNMGFMNDFLEYMKCDPYFRHEHYGDLTFSLIYAYSENFILPFSHDEVVHGKASMIGKMPGRTEEEKFANLRVAYGYMMTHPGKKLLFMGQDFAQYDEWNEDKTIEWDLLQYDFHAKMNEYVKCLNKLYKTETSLFEEDYNTDGFEWINNISSKESIVVFARHGKKTDDMIIVVCNFDTIEREDYKIGVPKKGKYKEIFNSDAREFGGTDFVNKRLKVSKTDECDGREESIRIKVPALGITILKYSKAEKKATTNNAIKKDDTKKIAPSRVAKKIQKEIEKTESNDIVIEKTDIKPVKKSEVKMMQKQVKKPEVKMMQKQVKKPEEKQVKKAK